VGAGSGRDIMAKELRGIIPAVITPFTTDERVDEAAFRKVLNVMIDHGVHGLFPVGDRKSVV
jgi:4-hydroxy-tetrahydrodipicolinate synthase